MLVAEVPVVHQQKLVLVEVVVAETVLMGVAVGVVRLLSSSYRLTLLDAYVALILLALSYLNTSYRHRRKEPVVWECDIHNY